MNSIIEKKIISLCFYIPFEKEKKIKVVKLNLLSINSFADVCVIIILQITGTKDCVILNHVHV